MRILILLAAMISFQASAAWVEGYTRSDGTYVNGHWSDDSTSQRAKEREQEIIQDRQRSYQQQSDFERNHQKPDLNNNLYGNPYPSGPDYSR